MMLESAFILMREKASFVNQFLRNPRRMGSIIPSSNALCKEVITSFEWNNSIRIAELGAGNGVLTRQLLARMSKEDRLDVFEVSSQLLEKLSELKDSRMTIFGLSAEYLSSQYDVILSGLPLLSLPEKVREGVLCAVYNALTYDGVFVQIQYTSFTQPYLSRYFTWKRKRVIRNIPPAWIYRCTHYYGP